MFKFLKIKNWKNFKIFSKGITLVEIIVAIFIITIFSAILIADFPKIQRQFALSRATYKLAQELRKTEDLGLSGVQTVGITNAKGYGVYFNISAPEQYSIYAETCPPDLSDYKYTDDQLCSERHDDIVEIIDISKEEQGVYIKELSGADGGSANSISINFTPPNPNVTITKNSDDNSLKVINIVLGLYADASLEKTISVNISGLIEIK